MSYREIKLSQIAALIGVEVQGNNVTINGLGLCNRPSAYPSIVSYIGAPAFVDVAVRHFAIKALFVNPKLYSSIGHLHNKFSFLISDKPEAAFYDLHSKLCQTDFYHTALEKNKVGINCSIHPSACIEQGVVIGDNVTIGANSVINSRSSIGDNSYIGCCSVIGSQGFQIIRDCDGRPVNVKHVGGTKIGKNVWIGDCVTVCNALFEGSVVVGDYCQIDNHTQIAHNCVLGTQNVLTAGVTMLGSAELRNNCWLAPGSFVMNRIVVEDESFIGINSTAKANVPQKTTIFGNPAVPIEQYAETQYKIKKFLRNQ